MKDEILYISGSCKEADYFLKDLAERLDSIGIDFFMNRKEQLIETEKYNIYAAPIYGRCLSLRNRFTRYYLIGNNVDMRIFHDIFCFNREAKELYSIDEIIGIAVSEYEKLQEMRKEFPTTCGTDICLKYSEENIRRIFKEHPEVKQVFKESLEEMKKPENIQKMADNTCEFMDRIQAVMKMNPEERKSVFMSQYQQEPIAINPCWIDAEKGILKECIHNDRGFDCRECERMEK